MNARPRPDYPGDRIVSEEQAKKLARKVAEDKKYRDQLLKKCPHGHDTHIMSASEIVYFVKATGMISPFYVAKGKEKSKSLLKHASYEGRIGNHAYLYEGDHDDPTDLLQSETARVLRIPENSIVFVESDLEFRIPDFIAMRFNLQIQHIHRGLLLGTGPLIDPGFHGKLCIPLHNLTNKEYVIGLDEGLIWIEFSKILPDTGDIGRRPTNSRPSPEEFQPILQQIEKAAIDRSGRKVPIKSSIPDAAKSASQDAKSASQDAKSSAQEAEEAKNSAQKSNNLATLTAAAGGIISFAAIVTILLGYWGIYLEYKSEFDEYRSTSERQIMELNMQIEELQFALEKLSPAEKVVPNEQGQQAGDSADDEASKPDADASVSGDADLGKKNSTP